MSRPLKLLPLAIATLFVGALAVSNQSFWIDEGAAAMKAIQPTVHDWWQSLRAEGNSNLQLLPHLFYLWVWEKIFGASEISLRAANLPLLFAGLAAAVWGLQRRPKLQFWFCTLALVNAFTWYYTSEARPYIMLFAASCLALGALVRMVEEAAEGAVSRLSFAFFCCGIFLVSFTSLIAVPWAAAWFVSAVVLLGLPHFLELLRRNLILTLAFLVAMTALAIYYAWTVRLGARASGIATTNVSNLFFILYEQLGLTGFGPGRTELRLAGTSALRPYALPLAIGLVAIGVVAWQALRSISAQWWRSRQALAVLVGVVIPLGLVLLAGHVSHVRILGRHLTPLFPIVLFVLALGLRRLQEKQTAAARIALVLVPLVFLISALEVRFASRHARDDYRGAAALALQDAQEGGNIWWLADQSTGLYYGLPLGKSQPVSRDGTVVTPELGEIARAPAPTMIVISKGDVYDPGDAVAHYAAEHGYRQTHALQSFRILEKSSQPTR